MARTKSDNRTRAEEYVRDLGRNFCAQDLVTGLGFELAYAKNTVKRMLMCNEVVADGRGDGPRGKGTRQLYKPTASIATGNNG